MIDRPPPPFSGAWFPAGVVRAACLGYVAAREAQARESADRRLSEALRQRCWWAPWRRPTMAEALERAGRPLAWAEMLALECLGDDRRVARLLALADAALRATGPHPMLWLSAADAAVLAATMPTRSAA